MLFLRFLVILLLTFRVFTPTVYGQSGGCDGKELTPPEVALCNLNKGLAPEELVNNIQPKGDSWVSSIKSALDKLFKFQITLPGFFASRAEVQSISDVPEEVSAASASQAETTALDLGGASGIYTVDLPNELKSADESVCDSQKKFAEATFPEGISPFGECQ